MGSLGNLSGLFLLVDLLDDTDGNSLFHISDGESSEGWELVELFNSHWLLWDESHNAGVTGLDELWFWLVDLSSSSVDLSFQFFEFAGDVSSVAIQHWGVTLLDLSWMVEDDDLGQEVVGVLGWVVLGVRGNISSLQVLDGQVLDVESNIVSWFGFWEGFVMHFDGFALSGDVHWAEGDDHTWLQHTGFNSSDWDCSDTSDLVDVLQWESQWLVLGSLGWVQLVQGFHHGWASVPLHVLGLVEHVVSVPA